MICSKKYSLMINILMQILTIAIDGAELVISNPYM